MKKKNIINLIKYYAEENDAGFRNEAYEIAKDFDSSGDYQLAEYIMALMSNANVFVPQIDENGSSFFEELDYSNEPLPLPEIIENDILGLINAISKDMGIHKFIFEGAPGTGKTESVKQIARILDRKIFSVNMNYLVDSKLGQTQKNISELFSQINSINNPKKVIILFDEIDAIALDRNNSNDLREMGRATSTILKELEKLKEQIVLIATTNMYKYFDSALKRRFDYCVNFDRYTNDDLIEIAEILLNKYINDNKVVGKNIRLFKKIISIFNPIPYPGDLKNMIRSSIAFSKNDDPFDYLKRLYKEACEGKDANLYLMHEQGFTVREIELLTGISKSQVAKLLSVGEDA